jgi:endoglucanase
MKLPRWRGFNLLEAYKPDLQGPFRESDFDLIAGWGFDFVRLPTSYWCWSTAEEPRKINEAVIREIDRAIELGRQRKIHVNLNVHRAPGWCVNPPWEKRDLFSDDSALDDFAYLWRYFAERYRGIPSTELSFDLLNEPPDLKPAPYVKVVTRLVAEIRAVDPSRLIIADGLKWGREPVPELALLGIGQSGRGYEPMGISHWKASWVKESAGWPKPTWPLKSDREWNRQSLSAFYEPWRKLEAAGSGVHMGEFGAHNTSPHDVTLAWLADLLAIWREAGWGWALWNLRGTFGVMDSGRQDVAYETLGEHKLDRKMLELLRAN